MKQAALVVTPHPVSLEGRQVYMPDAAPLLPGDTLAEFVGRYGVLPEQQWVVEVDGVVVVEADWPMSKPSPGAIIECRRVPNKDAMRIIAFAVLSYFTFGVGGLGAAGASGSAGIFAAGGAIGGGVLAAGCAALDGAYW